MKIRLFMCACAIIVTAHKDNISEMYGIGKKMPITMACFTVASLGIAGMPFIVGFGRAAHLGLILFGKLGTTSWINWYISYMQL